MCTTPCVFGCDLVYSGITETVLEHHELYTAQKRQLRLEAQTLRQTQDQERQSAMIAHERDIAIQRLKSPAEEPPELLKLQWIRQLSQQSEV